MLSREFQETMQRNRQEYGDAYDTMKWLTPETAAKILAKRQALVDSILGFSGPQWAFSGTKLYTRDLSPGCVLCGQGAWSCLFINGVCNARCFYCPSAQDDAGPPVTNTLVFEKAEDYADYVNRLDIRGVSFSGGEPLLNFDRVRTFLKVLKARADHPVYTWMYTNGILATREKLTELQDSGLDEIRFDISADCYRLDALEKAAGRIPTVTVEIPAIPEDLPVTRELIADLANAGVDFLNLHQIRCTPYNRRKLADRGYTFVHGPKVTVLETELAALELMRHSLERSIALPINYCAHAYQHQFQAAGTRRRSAGLIKDGCEDVTPTGYIRRLTIAGPEQRIADVAGTLASNGVDAAHYSLSAKRESLSFAAALWPLIDFSAVRLKMGYSQAVLRNSVSYRHPFRNVTLNGGKTLVVEKQTVVPGIWLAGDEIRSCGDFIRTGGEKHPSLTAAESLWPHAAAMRPYETVAAGLAVYY